MKRLISVLALTFACAMAMAPAPALSADPECRALEVRMNAARGGGGGGNPVQARRYAAAIDAQKAQIGKARAQMRTLGCGGGSIVTLGGSGNRAACSKLNGALRSMNANLAKLNTQYKRLSGGGGGDDRRALRARYRELGCGQPEGLSIARKPDRADNGIAAVLGGSKSASAKVRTGNDIKRERRKVADELKIPGLDFAGDTFRTLCVRTCDGYYFPISFSTTKANFGRDLKACESMCPGTEVQLFMHKVPEEESEDMSDAEGRPYKAMSYAFAYRRDGVARNPACKCNAVQGMSIVNDGTAGSTGIETAQAPSGAPAPTPRIDAGLDRESVADAAGALDADAIREIIGAQEERRPVLEDVRVVGPIFLPDPSGAIDLKAPVRPLVR